MKYSNTNIYNHITDNIENNCIFKKFLLENIPINNTKQYRVISLKYLNEATKKLLFIQPCKLQYNTTWYSTICSFIVHISLHHLYIYTINNITQCSQSIENIFNHISKLNQVNNCSLLHILSENIIYKHIEIKNCIIFCELSSILFLEKTVNNQEQIILNSLSTNVSSKVQHSTNYSTNINIKMISFTVIRAW